MGFMEDVLNHMAKSYKSKTAEEDRRYQENQEELKYFAANEEKIRSAAENGDLEAIQYLASLYLRNNVYNHAKLWARKGAAINDAVCLYVLGEVAFAEEDFQGAINYFTDNVNINGDELSATALGNIYLNANEFDNEEYFFQIAFKRNNTNGEAALGLAACIANNNGDIDQMKRFLQIASRSSNYATRDAANQIIREIQKNEAEDNRSQNNNDCFITTATCDNFGKADDCYELKAFRKFRDGWLKLQSDGKALIDEYYRIAPGIVAKINSLPNAKNIYNEIWDEYLSKCLRYIENGDYKSCKNLYVNMVKNLKARFIK